MRPLCALLGALVSELRRRPGAGLATLLSMAAGVAVFVAIAQANRAAHASFRSAVAVLSGPATHEVVRPGGIPQARFAEIAVAPGVRAAQPLIESRVAVSELRRDGRALRRELPPLRILGIDPFFGRAFAAGGGSQPVPAVDLARLLLEPGAVLLPEGWASEAGARPGDVLVAVAAGLPVRLTVLDLFAGTGVAESARDTALLDISTAQEVSRRLGAIDRIELIVDPEKEDALRTALAPGESLQRPEQRSERLIAMSAALRHNLLSLGGLALVVGALLVFDASQLSVIRRESLLGRLRLLGASRRTLLAALLAETTLVGALGGALGLLAGLSLARALVRPLGRTLSDLYAFVEIELPAPSPALACGVIAGAGLVALVAGALPALDATRRPPRQIGIRSRGEGSYRLHLPRLVASGVVAALGAVAFVAWPTIEWWPGHAAAFCLLAAAVFWTPPLMHRLLPWIVRRAEAAGLLLLPLAAGAVHRSLRRTGGAAAGLAVALSMTVAVVVMVGSFQRELDRWVERAIRADLFVGDAASRVAGERARIPAAAIAELRKTPGVRALDTLRWIEVPLGNRRVPVVGVEWPLPESRRYELLAGDPDEAVDRALAGGLLVSEPLARRLGLEVGDRLPLPTSSGPFALEIFGVFRDFSQDRGLALTGAETFVRLFGDPGIRSAALYLEPSADAGTFARELRARLAGRFALEIRSNRELRREVGEIFDRTFAVTYVLQTLATSLAVLGIAVTLFGLFRERARELATLRALGMSLPTAGRLFGLEALLLALFPVAIALPLGGALAWILLAVIQRRAFGWTLGYTLPLGPVAATAGLAVLAGLAAAFLPLALTRHQTPATALRDE